MNTGNRSVVFFVSESEYPKLQRACPGDFPFTYAEFVARVDEGIKHLPEGFTIVKVNVDVREFIAWCADTEVKPDNKARSRYAVLLDHRLRLN